MVRATFQLAPGVGGRRERRLWDHGITDWSGAASAPAALLGAARDGLLRAIDAAETALARGDLTALAAALPTCEHWRLYGAFAERAVFLDIETDCEGVTAVGVLDRDGPRLFLGDDVGGAAAAIPPDCLLVTFNGAAFDVPHLRRALADWQAPRAHLDLKPALARVGQRGGLKAIEERLGLGRPDHLRGLHGARAANLYRHGRLGDGRALRLFAEYNLYDAINLRTLAALAYNQLVAALGLPVAPVAISYRGDVLYDVTKLLMSLPG